MVRELDPKLPKPPASPDASDASRAGDAASGTAVPVGQPATGAASSSRPGTSERAATSEARATSENATLFSRDVAAAPRQGLEAMRAAERAVPATARALEAPKLDMRLTDPLRQGYASGDVVRPRDTDGAANYPVASPAFYSLFNQGQRSLFFNTVGRGEQLTQVGFDSVMAQLDTPEKLAAFNAYFKWVDNHQGAETYSPFEMLALGKGVCRDQHVFDAYAMRLHGREAHVWGYGSPSTLHAIATFRADDGTWGVKEYNRVHNVGAATEAEALAAVMPDALRFRKYEDPSSPTQRPGAGAYTLETPAGLELKRYMQGGDYGPQWIESLQRPPGAGAASFDIAADTGGITGRFAKGRFSADVRAFLPDTPNGLLEDAVGLGTGYDLGPLTLRAGAIMLPNAFHYSVGPRQREEDPQAIGYISGHLTPTLLDVGFDKGKRVSLKTSADVRGALALSYGAQGLDYGVTHSLSHLDTTLRTELAYRPIDEIKLWAASSAYVPVVDVAGGFVSGLSLTEMPVSAYSEAGVDAQAGRLAASASAYVPMRTRTNLLASDPRWQLSAAYALGASTSAVASVGGDFAGGPVDRAFAGLRWRALTAGVGASTPGPGMDKDKPELYGRVSLDVLQLVRGLGK